MSSKRKSSKELAPEQEVTAQDPSELEGILADISAGKATDPTDDLINLEELRADQSFDSDGEVETLLSTVPVRKPGNQTFFRTHPDPEYRVQTFLLKFQEDGEYYLLSSKIRSQLAEYAQRYTVHTVMERQGVTSLWPIRMVGDNDAKDHMAWISSREAAKHAEQKWTKLVWKKALGAYVITLSKATNIPPPKWPDKTFQELLNIAFGPRWIKDLNHPVAKMLLEGN